MKVLIVCGGNAPKGEFVFEVHQSFVHEQMVELSKEHGVEFDLFLIKGKGISGYLKNLLPYWKKLLTGRYDLVHAHDGTAGVLAVLRLFIPVIVTFHGSDIYLKKLRRFSSIAMYLATFNIFVDRKIHEMSGYRKKNYAVIPCGYDEHIFYPMDRAECRASLGFTPGEKYVIFSSDFVYDGPKNYELAEQAVQRVKHPFHFLPLVGYSRDKVRTVFNAVDALLVTSSRETGPLVVKEAMACNCPIVATDVGYVREVTDGVEGCYVTSNDPAEIAATLDRLLSQDQVSNGSEKVGQYSNSIACNRISEIYQSIGKTKPA